METMTTVVITPGRATGNIIFQKACHVDAPSIKAASKSSLGMLTKYDLISKIEKGVKLAIYSKIKPMKELVRCSFENMK